MLVRVNESFVVDTSEIIIIREHGDDSDYTEVILKDGKKWIVCNNFKAVWKAIETANRLNTSSSIIPKHIRK